jgi:glycosyltransferase involved in cell wall biosynthesis
MNPRRKAILQHNYQEKAGKDFPVLSYILITAARNEEELINNTIQSVISQTVLPNKWIIVSDGSTDRTEEIVSRYSATHPWVELLRMPEHKDRNFASKVHCFNAGYQKIRQLRYDIVGNLDADITFEPDYFEFLLGKFAANPKLGVAGTPFVEGTGHYDFRYASIEHVSGACQLFRRECFEEIGGYIPVKEGGIDWIAVTTARMRGWITRTFTEKSCFHHRKIGTGDSGQLASFFKYGKKNYLLGGHPLWQIFRAFFQMRKKPFVIGGLLLISGYACGFLTRMKRPLSRELLQFYRREQMTRLKQIIARFLDLNRNAIK